MVSETDNIEVAPDNTVTTPLRRDLLAEITTGEGLGKLNQPGSPDHRMVKIVQNSGCTDVEIAY